MYVFLDSNFCYTDPFMQENIYNRILLELAEAGYITLCMSEVVRREIINNFEKEVTKHFQAIENNRKKLMEKYLRVGDESPFEWKHSVEHYVGLLEDRLTQLEEDGHILIIPYSNELLPELVERSIQRIKPFTDSKQEFRDAIIWLSYVDFVKRREHITNCYFITNNSNDFMKDGRLHPDLEGDSTAFTMYKNVQEFIQKSDEVKSIQKAYRLELLIEEQDFPNNPDTIMNKLYDSPYFNEVSEACSNFLLDYPYHIPVKVETFETPWLELKDVYYMAVEDVEAKTILETILITGYLVVEAHFAVYERNPLYEPGSKDTEYVYLNSEEAILSVQFSLDVNENLEIEYMNIDTIEVE